MLLPFLFKRLPDSMWSLILFLNLVQPLLIAIELLFLHIFYLFVKFELFQIILEGCQLFVIVVVITLVAILWICWVWTMFTVFVLLFLLLFRRFIALVGFTIFLRFSLLFLLEEFKNLFRLFIAVTCLWSLAPGVLWWHIGIAIGAWTARVEPFVFIGDRWVSIFICFIRYGEFESLWSH